MASVVEIDAQKSIEYQARKWLVRMDGDEPLTVAEKQALRDWMSRSPLHRAELERLCRFWNQANVLTELLTAFESERREHKRPYTLNRTRIILMSVGVVLSSVVLIYCGLQHSSGTVTHIYETPIGRQKTVLMSDGSSIQLNTDTEIRVAYGRSSRRVRLSRGEALFSVARDPNRAFEVYAADSIVRAVGTTFVVHLDGRRVDVTVTNGAVDVADAASLPPSADRTSTGASPIASNIGRLKAGEVTSFASGSGRMEVQHLAAPALRRRVAWQEGYLAFSGEPLSEVVAQLNRYSTRELAIGDPRLASIAIGGRFRIGDQDAVLELLRTTFGIRADPVNDRMIRLESDREH